MAENESPAEEAAEQPARSRVTKLHVGRVYNLGNYENQRVEITVDVADGDDPGRVLGTLGNILRDLRAASGYEHYQIERARALLAKPESELDEGDSERLENARKVVAAVEAAKARRQAAHAALATLEYTSEHIDHKDNWSDDGGEDYVY